jgi:hypothetical protein
MFERSRKKVKRAEGRMEAEINNQAYAIRVYCYNCGYEFTSYVQYGKTRPEKISCLNCGCEAHTSTIRREI